MGAALAVILAFAAGLLMGWTACRNRKEEQAQPRRYYDKPLPPEAQRMLADAGVLSESFWERDGWTIEAMRKQGGSFVKALAEMAARADRFNLERIKRTWPEYWGDYEEMGQVLRFEACAEGLCDGSGKVPADGVDSEGNIERGVDEQDCLCRTR